MSWVHAATPTGSIACVTSVTAKVVPKQFVHGCVFALTVCQGCIDVPGP